MRQMRTEMLFISTILPELFTFHFCIQMIEQPEFTWLVRRCVLCEGYLIQGLGFMFSFKDWYMTCLSSLSTQAMSLYTWLCWFVGGHVFAIFLFQPGEVMDSICCTRGKIMTLKSSSLVYILGIMSQTVAVYNASFLCPQRIQQLEWLSRTKQHFCFSNIIM